MRNARVKTCGYVITDFVAASLSLCSCRCFLQQRQIPFDERDPLLDAGIGPERVGRGVLAIINQLLDGGGGHVTPGVARGVINQELAVFAGAPAVRESDIRDIAHPLRAVRRDYVNAMAVDVEDDEAEEDGDEDEG